MCLLADADLIFETMRAAVGMLLSGHAVTAVACARTASVGLLFQGMPLTLQQGHKTEHTLCRALLLYRRAWAGGGCRRSHNGKQPLRQSILWVLEECRASLALHSWESHAAVSHRIPFTVAAAMSHQESARKPCLRRTWLTWANCWDL